MQYWVVRTRDVNMRNPAYERTNVKGSEQSPKINPNIHRDLVCDKGGLVHHGAKERFNRLERTKRPMGKTIKLDPRSLLIQIKFPVNPRFKHENRNENTNRRNVAKIFYKIRAEPAC